MFRNLCDFCLRNSHIICVIQMQYIIHKTMTTSFLMTPVNRSKLLTISLYVGLIRPKFEYEYDICSMIKELISQLLCFPPSRESDGAVHFDRTRTRLGVIHFQAFRLFLFPVYLLLVRSHQAAIIIVKRLI